MKCKICGNIDGNILYTVEERKFGLGDTFTYFQCGSCDCLQIQDIPETLSKYYPADFNSFTIDPSRLYGNRFYRPFLRLRDTYAVFGEGAIGKLLYNRYPSYSLKALSCLPLSFGTSILDIGCGSGFDLYALRELGFYKTLGLDPFIKEDISYVNGTTVVKGEVFSLNRESTWDIIMLHHSFEHMDDPAAILKAVSNLLSRDGVCIIRIPIVPCYAWSHYREHWVQLDAPRHFFLHSVKSMRILAEQCGLTVSQPVYDSTNLQFYGSEQYVRNIPLNAPESYHVNRASTLFSRKQLRTYDEQSRRLNRDQQGDQAVFYISRKPD